MTALVQQGLPAVPFHIASRPACAQKRRDIVTRQGKIASKSSGPQSRDNDISDVNVNTQLTEIHVRSAGVLKGALSKGWPSNQPMGTARNARITHSPVVSACTCDLPAAPHHPQHHDSASAVTNWRVAAAMT